MAGQKRSNNLLLAVAVLTFVVGATLVALVLRNEDDGGTSASPTDPLVPVLVATKDIAKDASGAAVSGAVDVRRVPLSTRAADALTAVTDLSDKVALVQVVEGDQLRASYFVSRTLRGNALAIPEGKQAVAIQVRTVPAVAGYISKGDFVDVYAVYNASPDIVGANRQVGRVLASAACGKASVVDLVGTAPEKTVDADCAVRLLRSNVQVLERSFEQAPIGSPGTTTTVAGSTGSVTRDPQVATITFLVALDANAAEQVIFFQSFAEMYLTLKPQQDGRPTQPDSVTRGRTSTNALQP